MGYAPDVHLYGDRAEHHKVRRTLLAIAGLFILIGLKLAAPVLAAFGFDEKFAAQMFYPFCWGVATFALAFPMVKEVTLYVCYALGVLALSIYNGESTFFLIP